LYVKFIRGLRQLGFYEVFKYVANLPYRKYVKHFRMKNVYKKNSLEDRFTYIYNRNLWGNSESKSGYGSSLRMTHNVRNHLPKLFMQFGVNSVLDAPCGDFNWMKHVNLTGIKYIGGEIVASLVSELNDKYSGDNLSFRKLDLRIDKLPLVDLVIIRDCFFHLSFNDIKMVMKNFLKSESKYLLTTSHTNTLQFDNHDIESGDFRRINLFAPPFSFPEKYLYEIIEDSDGISPNRALYLWNRNDLSDSF